MISDSFLRTFNQKQFIDLAQQQQKRLKVCFIRNFHKMVKEAKKEKLKCLTNQKKNYILTDKENQDDNYCIASIKKSRFDKGKHPKSFFYSTNCTKRTQLVSYNKFRGREKTPISNVKLQFRNNDKLAAIQTGFSYKKPFNHSFFRDFKHAHQQINPLEVCKQYSIINDPVLSKNTTISIKQTIGKENQSYKRFVTILKDRRNAKQ